MSNQEGVEKETDQDPVISPKELYKNFMRNIENKNITLMFQGKQNQANFNKEEDDALWATQHLCIYWF